MPKITDFGLAKHLEKDTTQTREGSILGTPSYMAPEQAEGRNKDIGPASDIYSLGAILYDLLASRPPFRGETVMDTLHQVINVDPVPPTQLQPRLARDLEIICLKCLQKDIKKRYSTAAELADDLARFLHNEPIQARATPAWEKAVKWARRRPALASLMGLLFMTIVGLIAGSSWYARHESQRANTEAGLRAEAVTERDRADSNAAEEKRQRKRADDKAAEAERQRSIAVRESDRARRRFRDAIAAVDRVVIQAAAQRLQHVPQLQTVRRELLQDALHFYRLYLVDKGNDPALREDNGITHRRMGDILEKLGETRKAEDAYKTALVFFTGLLEETPRDLHYRRNVAETSNNLAIVLQTREQFAEAAKVLDRAVLLLRGMEGDYPDALRKQVLVLGAAVLGPAQAGEQRWNAVWDLVAAETTTREANIRLALLGDSLLSRGNLRLALKQPGPAEEDFAAASALYEQLARQDPAEPEYPFHLAAAQNSLGGLLAGRDPNKAGAAFDRAIRLLTPLTAHFDRIASYRALLAQMLRNRAVVRMLHPRPGRTVEQDHQLVEKDLGDSVDLFARLAAEYTTVPEHRAELVNSRKTLAVFYDRRARVLCTAAVPRVKQAAAAWQKAIDLWERVVADAPRQRGSWNGWVNVTFNRIEMWRSQAQPREAEKDYRALVPVMEKRCQAFPGEPEYLADLALGLSGWAKVLRQLNRAEEADERLRRAIDRQGAAVQKKRTDATYHRLLCGYQLAAGDHKGAADCVRAWTRDVPPPQARYQEAAQVLARCASHAAKEDTAEGKRRAETYARDAVALLQKAVQQGFRNPTFLKAAAFDALKDRADFKEIARALEKK